MSMKEKILTHFRKIGPRRFVISTVLVLIITDLLNSWYLRLWWVSKDMSRLLLAQSSERSGVSLAELGPDSIRELSHFFDNSFYFFLFIILANNLFFYTFYLRRKLWAQGFVLFYALTAGGLSGAFLFDNGGLGTGWYIYNLVMVPVYLYIFLGVKSLKEDTVDLPKK
jgi:hypothetical protein